MSTPFQYKAFISYSHSDEALAKWLHRALETYRIPKSVVLQHDLLSNRLGTIFRDRDELASSQNLSGVINEALAESENLVVICTPQAAQSRWINEEIRTFCELRDPTRVLLVIAPDIEAATDISTIFPPILLERTDEPLAADARAAADGLQRATLKLIAGLLGVGFDELQRREQVRRRNRLLGASAATIALLTIGAGLLTQTQQAEDEAHVQRTQAESLVGYLVDDLEERLQEYEEVGEIDAGLAQALSYFAARDTTEMDAATLEKYRTALRGVGSVRIRQGKLNEALEAFQRAAAVGETLVERDDDNAAYWYELAQNTYYIGEAHWEMLDVPAAAGYIEQALEYARRAATLEPKHVPYQLELVFALNNVGAVNTRLQQFKSATTALTTALDNITRLRPDFPAYAEDLLNQEVESVSWLAEITATTGQFEAAFQWHQRELALHQQLFERSGNPHHQARTADALGFYAKTLAAVGRSGDAAAALQDRIELSRTLIKTDPDNVFWQRRLHMGELLLAQATFHMGDPPAAHELLNAAEQGMLGMTLEERDGTGLAYDLQYLATTRAYVLLHAQPEVALEMATATFAALQPFVAAEQVNPILLGYYLRAVIVRNAALHAVGQSPDAALTASAISLLSKHGEPEFSIYDKASNAILLLIQDDPAAHSLLEELDEIGYRSVFFVTMRDRFTPA